MNIVPYDTAEVINFTRESYEIQLEPEREPTGGRLWVGVAKFNCIISGNFDH